jgi:hypothetical protein
MASHISVINVFNNLAMTTSEEITHTVDLSRFNVEGFFSLQIILAGTGNVDVIWSASNDGDNFITPADTDDIFSAFGPASGPGSDGIDIASFDPLLAKWMKFTATGQGAGAITSINGYLAIQ